MTPDSFIVTIRRGQSAKVSSRRMTREECAGMIRRSRVARVHIVIEETTGKFRYIPRSRNQIEVIHEGRSLGVMEVVRNEMLGQSQRERDKYYSCKVGAGNKRFGHKDREVVAERMLETSRK